MKLLDLESKPDLLFEDLNKPDKSKRYIRVIGDFRLSYDTKCECIKGVIKPLILVYTDGRQYLIDYVSEPIKRASLKSGGIGLRYRCRIKNTQFFLFLENDIWFFERI